ncbi:unnamed protein product [Prorocentrum cordatum]|uniref:Uncharacterized protein n=1 Tax=Prorocentrum cordatum TaxID=2364126 RepID=A0ABN9XUM3_9DINO|nr:unnamed protein product [Polarella glacialis]
MAKGLWRGFAEASQQVAWRARNPRDESTRGSGYPKGCALCCPPQAEPAREHVAYMARVRNGLASGASRPRRKPAEFGGKWAEVKRRRLRQRRRAAEGSARHQQFWT